VEDAAWPANSCPAESSWGDFWRYDRRKGVEADVRDDD
jgi:hypothetical protein